jgi:hypothetical protein
MTAVLTLRLSHSMDFGNANSSTWGSGDVGAPSAENANFIVIQTHLSFGF